MRLSRRHFAALLFALVLTLPSRSHLSALAREGENGDVLNVRVVGLRNSRGKVICTLFASATGFPGDDSEAVADADVPIENDTAVCNFSGLSVGEYALAVFHDENDNGRFDRNIVGLPEEGYAFSNNVRPWFSPPSFNDAAFQYKGGEQSVTIKMLYGVP